MFAKHANSGAFQNHRWLNKFTVLLEDLHIIGHSPYLYFSAAASLPYSAPAGSADLRAGAGYGIDITWAGVCLDGHPASGTVVPQAPGNLGTFQAAAVFGLVLFGVDSSLAKRFSFVMWAVITLPLLIVGFRAGHHGTESGDIRQHAQSAAAPHQPEQV